MALTVAFWSPSCPGSLIHLATSSGLCAIKMGKLHGILTRHSVILLISRFTQSGLCINNIRRSCSSDRDACRWIFALQLADHTEVKKFMERHGKTQLQRWWMYQKRPVKLCEAVVLSLILDCINLLNHGDSGWPLVISQDRFFGTVRLVV